MVFQDYALFPHLTVAENVGFGLPPPRAEGARPGHPRARRSVRSRRSATRTSSQAANSSASRSRGLSRPARSSSCSTSRGRTSTRTSGRSMRDELARILRGIDVTVVLVTHDREEAFSLADRIALMRTGRSCRRAPPRSSTSHPRPAGRPSSSAPATSSPAARERRRRDARRRLPRQRARPSQPRVEVLIRPEQLELEPDPAGDGEVVGREFRGHDVFYRVLLDGVELVSHRPSTELVDVGDARLDPVPRSTRLRSSRKVPLTTMKVSLTPAQRGQPG